MPTRLTRPDHVTRCLVMDRMNPSRSANRPSSSLSRLPNAAGEESESAAGAVALLSPAAGGLWGSGAPTETPCFISVRAWITS